MIGVDTNLLVYSHRADSDWYARADERLSALAESETPRYEWSENGMITGRF